jgi:succinyl-CoA synthetase beta subunit
MNLHEYQSKQILAAAGLPVLVGMVAYTPREAELAFDILGSPVCVVKAQVHAGGRGKAGGVKVCKGIEATTEAASKILGMQLVTPQTGAKGKLVKKVYVEAGCNIDKEYYVSLLVDRSSRMVTVIASTEGGMEIEEVAEEHPEKIIKVAIDPKVRIQNFQCLAVAQGLQLPVALHRKFSEVLKRLYHVFLTHDMAMIEINPLVVTKEQEFVILDAKCAIDDNALFRHPRLRALSDYDELDSKDLRASKYGLSYIALDGNIGCMVNGAGLAMATMDIIKSAGGEPANFLDVGGGASKETVTEAFRILLSDQQVKGILVNIFGGIMQCDIIAKGIIEAASELGVSVPLVVRLQGTNSEQGVKLLAESGLAIIPAITMDEAAEKIVKAVLGK